MRLSLAVALVVATVVLSNPRVSAQPRLVFETLSTSGTSPSANFSINRPDSEITGFSVDPITQRVHWVHGNDWYRLDLHSRTWTRHTIRNGFDLHHPRWGVVPGTSDLLVWDSGVGRVVRVDSNGVGTRIDQSFDQKTQFGHLQYINDKGSIYAIGGTGLHHPKNYGITFSQASKGWHRITGLDLISNDPFVHEGLVLRDPMKNHLLLFTNYAIRNDQGGQGVLKLDLDSGGISMLHAQWTSLIAVPYGHFRYLFSSTVHTGEHRFGFVKSGRDKQSQRQFTLTAVSFDSYQMIETAGTSSSDLDPHVSHMVLHYSESDSSLYSVQWSHHSADAISIAVVQRAKVDVDAIRAALKKGKAPDKPKASGLATRSVWPWQAALAGVLLLLVGLWIRCRRIPPALPAAEPRPTPMMLHVDVDLVRVNGTAWSELFSPNFVLEGQLLELLARAALEGRPVVSSDTVDRVLIPNHPSLDYIRKTRNLTRKRLEESLQSVHPLPSGECYIQTDRDVADKRKTKLQLNTKWISVTPTG